MTQVTSLTAVDSFAPSNTDPTTMNFYATLLDADYRMTLERFRNSVGREVGALVYRTTGIGLPVGEISWQAQQYDPNGWWTSGARIVNPSAHVTHVQAFCAVQVVPRLGNLNMTFLKNGAHLNPRPEHHQNGNGAVNRWYHWQSGIIPVNSGDGISAYVSGVVFGSSLQVGQHSWFALVPRRFA